MKVYRTAVAKRRHQQQTIHSYFRPLYFFGKGNSIISFDLLLLLL